METYETIKVEVEETKATLTLSRPESLNTISLLMVEELIRALSALKTATINVLVLRAEGRKFCAGADMGEMRERPADEWGRIVERYLDIIRALVELPAPVLAAIQGDAVGGGLGLCVAADMRVAVNTARLGFPFIKIGLSGSDMGSSYYLPKLVGPGPAAEMLFTGKLVTADEARELGLVHRSVPPEDFESEVETLTRNFTEGPGYALRFTKQALIRAMDNSREHQFAFETYAQTQCLQSENHREGIDAYRNKRRPEYTRAAALTIA